MKKHYIGFVSKNWESVIKYCVRKTEDSPLIIIDEIKITQAELDTIDLLDDKNLRKLAFSFLCAAKFAKEVNPKNNYWINCSVDEIFKISNTKPVAKKQDEEVHRLISTGLIEQSKSIDNLNIRVTFVDNNSEVVLHIKDLRDSGWRYLMYKGENYSECESCGRMIRQIQKKKSKKRRRYCTDCLVRQEHKDTILITCAECGSLFEVPARQGRRERCELCRKRNNNLKKAEYRQKNNLKEE